jgi:hypothetical protein
MLKSKATAIAGFHLNHLTCGVARFNKNMGIASGLPVTYYEDVGVDQLVLLSIKLSEFNQSELETLLNWCEQRRGLYDLMLHGLANTELERLVVRNARRVISSNKHDSDLLLSTCGKVDVIGFCPASVAPKPKQQKPEVKILSFGMAHKLNEMYYAKLRDRLEENNVSFSVLFSTSVHEGYDFEESFLHVEKKIGDIFGDKSLFLGFLSDKALTQTLAEVDVFATFFSNGYRENNTSANAAMALGTCLLTNVDEHSPTWLKHGRNFLDMEKCDFTSFCDYKFEEIGTSGAKMACEHLSWDVLVDNVIAGI